MQRLLLSGIALAALAGVAFAQQTPIPPSAGTPPAAAEPSTPPSPPPAPPSASRAMPLAIGAIGTFSRVRPVN
ncbi:hypothetical protein ACC739_37310, partial [Rhizobium ruizarguesonis]